MNIICCVLVLVGLLSLYGIYRDCKKGGIKFSIYESYPLYEVGFSCGVAGVIILVVNNLYLCF